ncbi:hypothetical protein ACA910_016932 [Epithemia clementina (nom. ined.)]
MVASHMKQYIDEAEEEFGEDVSTPVAMPADEQLFKVADDAEKLECEQKEHFHSIVAKLLYLSQRACTDIQPTIPFLCTRVAKSTMQDWKKLKGLLQYLVSTCDLELVLGADNFPSIHTWVDASYAVHEDMCSHTGGITLLGHGGIMCKSMKQKINTKSSTEAEVMGVSDYLLFPLWAKLFLEAQGHEIKEMILAQDNQSAMRLEQNGRALVGQKSHHINIRHFFVTDRVKQDGLTIRYCPTETMIAFPSSMRHHHGPCSYHPHYGPRIRRS